MSERSAGEGKRGRDRPSVLSNADFTTLTPSYARRGRGKECKTTEGKATMVAVAAVAEASSNRCWIEYSILAIKEHGFGRWFLCSTDQQISGRILLSVGVLLLETIIVPLAVEDDFR